MHALLFSLLLAAAAPAAPPAPATPAAPAEVPLPKLSSVTLDNGLKVVAFERHEQPVFIARMAIPAGQVHEPKGQTGLAAFTAGILTKGTASRDANAIIGWLDTHGAELSAGASEDFTVVSAQGLARDFDAVLGLLADSVLHPTFPKEEVERLRPQLDANVRRTYDDPASLAAVHADYLLFGYGYPLGRPETPASVAAVDAPALDAFYQANYRPNGAVLVLAGDFDAAKVLEKVKATFASWARKDVPPVLPPPLLAKPRIRVVDKPDATQAQIRLVHAMPPRNNPDAFALKVMNAVLGAGSGSRLMAALREKEGKTYSIQTSVDETLTVGAFDLTTFTRNAEVAATLKKALAILADFKRDGPTAEELARAQGFLGGGFVVSNSEPRAIAASLLDQEAYGLGDDYVRAFRAKVQAVSIADAKAAAARYLTPPGFAVVLVGNASEILAQVKSAFPGVEVEVLEAGEPVADEESPRRVAAKEEKVAPSEVMRAREIFAAARLAAGGEEALKRATAGLVAEGTLTAGPPGEEQALPFTARWAGDKQRLELRAPGMLQVMVLTQTEAYAQAGGEKKPMPPALAAQQRVALLFNFPQLLTLPSRPDIQLAYLRDDVRNDDGTDVPVQVVEVREAHPGAESRVLARLHFDAKTHLPYGYLRNVESRQELLRFLDYQKQEELLFPMRRLVKVDGQKASDVSFQRVTLRPLPDEQFTGQK